MTLLCDGLLRIIQILIVMKQHFSEVDDIPIGSPVVALKSVVKCMCPRMHLTWKDLYICKCLACLFYNSTCTHDNTKHIVPKILKCSLSPLLLKLGGNTPISCLGSLVFLPSSIAPHHLGPKRGCSCSNSKLKW